MPNSNNIRIFQIPMEGLVSSQPWLSLSFDEAARHGFSLGGYDLVFEEDIDTSDMPEGTYGVLAEICRADSTLLVGFPGREISVSDVISIGQDYYYVDRHGFALFDPGD